MSLPWDLLDRDGYWMIGGERDERPTFPFVTEAARYAALSTGVGLNGWRSH